MKINKITNNQETRTQMQQQTLFKLKHNDEIHRVRGSIHSYNDLLQAVSERFQALEGFTLQYKDTDNDLVRISCEEDFAILLEEFEGKKAIKIIVKASSEKPEPVEITLKQPEEATETQPEQTAMEEEKPESSDQTSSDEDGKKCKGKKWRQKKRWFKKKFQKNLDDSIQKAIPEIATQVAEILGKRPQTQQPEDLKPVKMTKQEEGENVKMDFFFPGKGHFHKEFNPHDMRKMFKHSRKMFHEMMGGEEMWRKKKAHMKQMWREHQAQNGEQPGCPMKFFKKMFCGKGGKFGGKGGKGHCGMWKKWKQNNPDFDWKNMTPEKKFWFKMMKNKRMFFKMMKNEEFFNKMLQKFNIDPKNSPELMKVLEQKKAFWQNFKEKKTELDYENMSDEEIFWCKVMKNKHFFWRMLKNPKFFAKKLEEHGISAEKAPEMLMMLKAKKLEANEMKGCKKFWKRRHRGRHGGRHGHHGSHHGGPMRKFWRMMMGGRARGQHWGPHRRHGGRRHGHGGPRRHGCGKFWRKHGQRQEMSYEDQLQEAIKRSLGLDTQQGEEVTIENEGMAEEMPMDKKVMTTSESSDSNTSSGTSDSNTSDSDSMEQPEMPNPVEQLANVAQCVLGAQGQQNQANLGQMIQQGLQMFGNAMQQQTQTQGRTAQNSEEDALQEAIRLSLDEVKEDKPVKKQKVEDDESFEDLYEDGEQEEAQTTQGHEEKPKVVECTLNLDAVAMENTKQICAVFGVPEEKNMIVYKWVKAKKTNAVNELLNLYIDEMAGRM